MATWIQDSAGGYRLVGTGRTSFIATEELPSEKAFILQLLEPSLAHDVKVLMPASGDGRSAFEIGLSGPDIVIRSVEFGDPASVVVRDSAAHGLPAGVPFTLRVEILAGVISAYLNGSDTAIVTYDNGSATPPLFEGFKHFGFVSNVNGARVISAKICDLVPETVNRADVLVAVCGGDVFASVDGGEIFLVRSGVFNATGDVALAAFEQKMYGVDGAHAKIIDPITFTVTDWTATAGALPGHTTDGTTNATLLTSYGGALWVNDGANPQNLLRSALNAPLDWDTGSTAFGKAFGLTAALIGRIGQPITCLFSTTRNTLGIGCISSVWELIGRPETSIPELQEMLKGSGISGKDAVTVVAEGRAVIHTAEGPYMVPAVGDPIPFAAGVLSEGINIPKEDIQDYAVQVRRDPARHGVHFLLTPRVGDGPCTHIWYDETTGGYQNAQGGWFPDDFAERFGPTASTPEPYLGKIIWGTRDGHLMYFEDAQANANDDGDAVVVRCPVSLMQEPKILRETILHRFSCLQGVGAAIKYRLWGASRPESVYDPASVDRYLLQSGQFTKERTAVDRKSRAPALMLELYNDQTTGLFEVEQVDAVTTAGRIITRQRIVSTITGPCVPSYYGSTLSSGAPTYSSGPPYTTQFSSSEGTSPSSEPSSSASSSSGGTFTLGPPLSTPHGFTDTILFTLEPNTTEITGPGGSTIETTVLTTELTIFSFCTEVSDPLFDDATICNTDFTTVGGDEGWTLFEDPASYGAKTVYLAPQTGNDANSGLTELLPKLTWAAAYALITPGAGDHLVIKRGETLSSAVQLVLSKAGASAARRMVVGAYGNEALARPVINFTGTAQGTLGFTIGGFQSAVNYVAITHLEIKPNTTPAPNAAAGVSFFNGADFLLEGCYIHQFTDNVVVEGNPHENPAWRPQRPKLRRNVLVDSFDPGDDRSQGIFMDDVDEWLIEENVLDDNGVEGSIFSRNCYVGDKGTDGTFAGNVSHNSASEGVQQRAGGLNQNNLYIRNSYGMTIGLNFNVAATVRYNVVIDSKNISPTLTRGMGIFIENTIQPCLVERNCVMFNVQGTGQGSVKGIFSRNAAGGIFQDNYVYDWHSLADPESHCFHFENGTAPIFFTRNKANQVSSGILVECLNRSPSTVNAVNNQYGWAGGFYQPFRPLDWVGWQTAVGGGEAGSTFGVPAAPPCSPATPDGMLNAVAGMNIAAYMTAMRLQRKGNWDASMMPYELNNRVRTRCGVPNP